MFVSKEQYKKFSEYMNKILGKDIISKTNKIRGFIWCFIIKNSNEEKLRKMLKKYKIKDYKIKSDIDLYKEKISCLDNLEELDYNSKEHVVFYYLEQYIEGDENARNKYTSFRWELDDFAEPGWTGCEVKEEYEKEFPNIMKEESFAYFIIDKNMENSCKDIVRCLTGKDIEFKYINAKNPDYGINDLAWFCIKDLKEKSKPYYSSYEIICMFLDAGINHCIYVDRDGEVGRKIDIRMNKLDDERQRRLGFRADLGKVFRSSWEADFARVLNYLNKNWKYEVKGFSLMSDYFNGTYFPDFFLEDNIIIEMKGFWNLDSRRKVKCFKQNYEEYKLLTIDSEMMNAIYNKYSDKIDNWESDKMYISKQKLPVVGINRAERKKYVSQIVQGDEVFLKREDDNKYDCNAIKVVDKYGNELGYIASDWAAVYSDKLDIGMKYRAMVIKKEPKVLMIEVSRINDGDDILYNFLKSDY